MRSILFASARLYYNEFMFKLENFLGKRVLKSSLINDEEVVTFFTTRDLPLKAGERDDLIEEIENNKKLVCKGLGIQPENLIIPQQTHSDNVRVVNGEQETVNGFANTDALITSKPNIALALNFADCVPIIFYDPVKKVIACAHAGWRGTAAKIGPKTVEKMVKEYGSNPEDIIALIGPSIGKCCFEAGSNVLEQLQTTLKEYTAKLFSNSHADLKLINKFQLLDIGVKKIDVCEYCTSCQTELFFSYRKENANTARHSALIMMRERK